MNGDTGIKYPEINLWNTEVDKIKFINSGDFRRDKLLRNLGLAESSLKSSFGISDRSEILKRQRLIKFLVDNESFRDSLRFDLDVTYIPKDAQKFLDYFDPKKAHNPFWVLISRFIYSIKRLSDKNIPHEVKSLAEFLSRTKRDVESKERKTVDRISREIQKATYLEGAIRYSVDCGWSTLRYIKAEESEVYGYQRYAYGLSDKGEEITVPNIFYKPIFNWTRIRSLAEKIVKACNVHKKRLAYSSYIITDIPEVLKKTVTEFLENKFRDANIPDEIKECDVNMHIFFRYSEAGLEIRLLNIDIEPKKKGPESEPKQKVSYVKADFPGYSRMELKRIRKKNRLFESWLMETQKKSLGYKMLYVIKSAVPGITWANGVKIDSVEVDKYYKWYAVSALCNDIRFKDSISSIEEYRDYIRDKLRTLKSISFVAEQFVRNSNTWNKPLCFPEILDDNRHLVSFEELEPIHLIGEYKQGKDISLSSQDLVPISSLSPLNGQMIGFTGQNAGGKSTTEEAIVNAIYLAQSGFPVFGKSFSLNVKKRIGMLFLERGSGSTLELLLRKTKNILESLNGISENEIVLVLDEIGTGTQESDGYDYGKRLLTKLSGSRCSVIFSTQITELAKYAQETLGAECFNFNLQHEITSGIGRGGIEKLMTEIGIDKLLN